MAPPRTNKESSKRAITSKGMARFEALESFIKKHDRLPYEDENLALCKWVWMQRGRSKNLGQRGPSKNLCRGLLQEERRLLESIGFFDFVSRIGAPRIKPAWSASYKN
jgi:hypothetical protein